MGPRLLVRTAGQLPPGLQGPVAGCYFMVPWLHPQQHGKGPLYKLFFVGDILRQADRNLAGRIEY